MLEERCQPMDEGSSPAGRWLLAAPPLLRVAGLPVSALAALRGNDTWTRLEELTSIDRWLAEEGAALADVLHEVIGGLADDEARPRLVGLPRALVRARPPPRGGGAPAAPRPRLVGLRRALFRARQPTRGEWDPSVRAVVPPEVAARTDAWCGRLADRRRMFDDLPGVLAADRERAHQGLRRAAGHAAFRRALSQAGPTLLDELDHWLDDDERRPKQQKLLRLAKYVARAAAKTSPYSTFTSSGLGTWVQDADVVRFAPAQSVHGVLELDGPFLAAVCGKLARHPALATAVTVRLNPSATEIGAKLEFIGRPPAEPIIGVDLTGGLRECLRLVGDDGERSLAELRGLLLAAASDADPDGVDRFLARLLDAGVLEARVPVPDHAPDPLGEMAAWLAVHPDLGPVRELVLQVRSELLRDVAVPDVEGHRARQAALHRAVVRLGESLGLDPGVVPAQPKETFHEGAVLRRPVARVPVEAWRGALDDLDVLRRWLTVFDWKLPGRLAVGSYCRERFGADARIPFSVLHRAVQEELARPPGTHSTPVAAELAALLGPSSAPWTAALADSPLERLRTLERMRGEARQVALPAPDPDGVVRVDAVALAEQLAGWPDWLAPPASVACYVQAHPSGLVLNTVHGGHGRGRSRVEYLMERAGASGDREATRERPATAELGGLLGSTLNVRAATAPYEIDYPGSVSARPAAERIALRDLVVVHDPATDLVGLCSPRHGAVQAVHLGMSSDVRLPPAAQFLVRVFDRAYLIHPSAPPLMPNDDFAIPERVLAYPRVEVGRIVLQRARWVAPSAAVPSRAKGEPDAHYLVRLAGWLDGAGIPSRCFVRVWGKDLLGEAAKARKPLYLDVADWFAVTAFERRLATSELVLFDEALPDPVTAHEQAPSVTEFLVELSDGRRARA